MFSEINYLPKSFDEMVQAMLTCEQTQGQSVFQHGTSVREYTLQLINYLKGDTLEGWVLPEWLEPNKEFILKNLHSENVIELYTQYHDCSKPCVLVTDAEGKRHFPNHASVSGYIWGLFHDNKTVKKLIENDMVLHTASSEEVDLKLKEEWSIKDACTLLIVSLAEIHSNAIMFGGISSVSFKIKWKKLLQRGKKVLNYMP